MPEVRDVDIKITIRRSPRKGQSDRIYIGGVASYPGGGGNDLADGDLTPETLDLLFLDIGAVSRGYRSGYDESGGKPIKTNLPDLGL